MFILIWELMLGFKSGMVALEIINVFFHYLFFRKLFETQKFLGSILPIIFNNYFFKNSSEFGNVKEFKDQARKINHAGSRPATYVFKK